MELNHKLVYRAGTMADKTQLKQLGIAAYTPYEKIMTPENAEKLHNVLQDDAKLEALIAQAKVFVCADGEALVGMAYLVPSGNPWDVFEAEWSYIRMVGVDPAYAGRGIARALTASCIEHAAKNNEQVIALHTSEFMDAARHVYESLGFKKIKEIAPRFGKIYWLYQLRLKD